MDVSNKLGGLWSSWPVRATGILLAQSTEPVWRRVVGANLTADEIERRKMDIPRHKAELGAAAVRHGIQRQDTELRHLGEAMVVKAMADTGNQLGDMVVREAVNDVAASLPLGDVGANPYIDPATADNIAEALGLIESTEPDKLL